MKMKLMAGIALASIALASCDDNTSELGSSLIDNADKLEITTDTFGIISNSATMGAVLSNSSTGYLGKVRDPETGAYLTSSFMTQFYTPEDFTFPEKDSIKSLDSNKNIVADSCDIRLYYTNYFGDSLATMKVSAMELVKPVPETGKYYTDFNPEGEYVTPQSMKVSKMYTLTDLNVDESTRNNSDYMPGIRIPLKAEYGTKIMNAYYEHPEYFKNAYAFIHHLVPGFYFKTTSGIGSMAYIRLSQLNVYFRHKTTYTNTDGTKKDTIYAAMASFPGTEEVLQTTRIQNDQNVISQLVADPSCTYIKSPAGIYTELTLPVTQIVEKKYTVDGKEYSHKNDTINSAKVVLRRINNTQDSKYTLGAPKTLLMLPKSDVKAFFENNRTADYKTSYLASYSSSTNTYTFNNIGSLIKNLYDKADRSNSDWNKVVLIPVSVSYDTSSGVTELISVSNDMSMTSTRLVRGDDDTKHSKITISVIYSKFK